MECGGPSSMPTIFCACWRVTQAPLARSPEGIEPMCLSCSYFPLSPFLTSVGDCLPGRPLSRPGWGVHGSLLPAVFTGTPTNRLDILPPQYDLIAGARDYCFSNSCFLVLPFLSSALPVQGCRSLTFSLEVSVGDTMRLARFRGQEGCCLGAVHPPHLSGSAAIRHSQSPG